jgi:hypothetical protein
MDKLKFYWAIVSGMAGGRASSVKLNMRFIDAEDNIRMRGFERLSNTLDLEFCPHITTVFCKCGRLMVGDDIKVYKNCHGSYYVSRGI